MANSSHLSPRRKESLKAVTLCVALCNLCPCGVRVYTQHTCMYTNVQLFIYIYICMYIYIHGGIIREPNFCNWLWRRDVSRAAGTFLTKSFHHAQKCWPPIYHWCKLKHSISKSQLTQFKYFYSIYSFQGFLRIWLFSLNFLKLRQMYIADSSILV